MIGEAQLKFGADVYSRYIWRGVDYGNSPSIQPGLSYSSGSFTVGTWGAYSFAGAATVFSEHDLYASYSVPIPSGTVSIYYTDYYYPSAGIKFLKYDGKGAGAHTLEAGIGYSGPESFPISLSVYNNFHNDLDKSTYVQASYPFSSDEHSISLVLGGTTGKSAWYGSSKANIINLGISLTKSLKISELFSLPVTASYFLNPEIEQSYLIVGITL